MAKFSVGGDDEDGDGKRPSNKYYSRLPKKTRKFDPVAEKASAATSNAVNPRSTSVAPQPPLVRESQPEKRRSFKRTCCSEPSEGEDEVVEPQTAGCGGGIRPTEARGNTTPNGNGNGIESVERRVDARTPLSVTLTDPDVLDCPICFEPLNPPVYQCKNGHISCEPCCIETTYKCATCSNPIGYNRCRAIENVLDSVRISCPNMQHGCKESLYYGKKLDHEKTCIYSPCFCPHPDCKYSALPSSVYSHFPTHKSNSSRLFLFNIGFSVWLDSSSSTSQKHVFLQETIDQTLFVLNRFIEHRGSLVSVVCIAPVSSERRYSYEVTATNGKSYVKLRSVAEMTPRWTGQCQENEYLLVPNAFMPSDGQMKLTVKIRTVG
ncbi:hypothetical protein OROGR_023683 [Orobanche gracilis]